MASPAMKPQKVSDEPKTYPEALKALRDNGYAKAADILELRVSQKSPKMKIDEERARTIAGYLLRDLPGMPKSQSLLMSMPRTTVELIVSFEERKVPKADAEGMADYLLRFQKALDFQNPRPFDINTSHVIGREWPEVDYSGENMTWQDQKKSYAPYGVESFKKAGYLHGFFTLEHKLPYFNKIYKPNGKFDDFKP